MLSDQHDDMTQVRITYICTGRFTSTSMTSKWNSGTPMDMFGFGRFNQYDIHPNIGMKTQFRDIVNKPNCSFQNDVMGGFRWSETTSST